MHISDVRVVVGDFTRGETSHRARGYDTKNPFCFKLKVAGRKKRFLTIDVRLASLTPGRRRRNVFSSPRRAASSSRPFMEPALRRGAGRPGRCAKYIFAVASGQLRTSEWSNPRREKKNETSRLEKTRRRVLVC